MSIVVKWLFIALFSLCALGVEAQQVVISGKVTDESTGAPLQNVLVTVRPADENKIISYARTSQQGKYEIKFPVLPTNHVLHFSMMGYAPQTTALSDDRHQYDVRLTEQATALKEVIIKAPGIRQKEDTISYLVSSFADAQDKSLADVLKKMPGIEVEKAEP